MRLTLTMLCVISLGGCFSPYNKAWNDIYVTKDPYFVHTCAYVDVFHSWPPYILPNDDIRNVTRRAKEAGADTVLVTGSRLVSTEGHAYKCH